ncbi:MAG: hypothetical protein ABSG93_13545 [Solirubrobacteraceae bacterium]|jgi:phosphatidylethanolamine-binding protein (PEBP) family uncharacterized protein
MRRRKITAGAVLLSALVLAGCGGTSANDVAKIAFASPALVNGRIPALYTCNGRNISPPLEWGAVPPGTGELAVFVLGFTPNPGGKTYAATIEWAVARVNPALHKLAAGVLPAGATVGRNSENKKRYSICPKNKKVIQYQFELYAVSASASIPANFVGFPIVAQLSNAKPSSGVTLGHGGFVASYDPPS